MIAVHTDAQNGPVNQRERFIFHVITWLYHEVGIVFLWQCYDMYLFHFSLHLTSIFITNSFNNSLLKTHAPHNSPVTPLRSPVPSRLFGGKQAKQQVPVTTTENMKNATVISNPHANSSQQGGALDSPSASSGGSSPLYGGGGRLGVEAHSLSPLASSPSSALSTPSHSLAWSSTLSRDTLSPGYPSLSSLATSSESIDLSLGSGGHGHHGPGHDTLPACIRNNGIKTGFSDR